MDFGSIDVVSVLVAAAVSFGFGALFYTVLGKPWMAALGKTQEELKANSSPTPFVIAAVCQLVLATTLALITGPDAPIGTSIQAALMLWFGIVMTTMTINHAFQQQKRALTLIDGAHWLGVLTLQGLVLGVI